MRNAVLVLLCLWLVTGGAFIPQVQGARAEELKIAGQFGLVYAPLMVAKARGIFERYGLKPVWKEYGSGGAVREAPNLG